MKYLKKAKKGAPKNDDEIQELIEADPYTYGVCILKEGQYNLRNYQLLL